MKQIAMVGMLLVSSVAIAGPKAKAKAKAKAPPPVPKYWIGEFVLDDDSAPEAKTVQTGFATVKAADAPVKALVLQPIDPKFTPASGVGAGDNPRIYSTRSYTPEFEERPDELPRVLIVDETTNPTPKVIKPSKVVKALRKKFAKDYPHLADQTSTWALGIADLDADGIGDVGLFYGCHQWDGGCSGDETMIYERDGAGWKEIKLHTDDE
jgi:hypothetical protein